MIWQKTPVSTVCICAVHSNFRICAIWSCTFQWAKTTDFCTAVVWKKAVCVFIFSVRLKFSAIMTCGGLSCSWGFGSSLKLPEFLRVSSTWMLSWYTTQSKQQIAICWYFCVPSQHLLQAQLPNLCEFATFCDSILTEKVSDQKVAIAKTKF